MTPNLYESDEKLQSYNLILKTGTFWGLYVECYTCIFSLTDALWSNDLIGTVLFINQFPSNLISKLRGHSSAFPGVHLISLNWIFHMKNWVTQVSKIIFFRKTGHDVNSIYVWYLLLPDNNKKFDSILIFQHQGCMLYLFVSL